MQYKYSSPIGLDVITDKLSFLEEVLKKPVTHWEQQAGDSGIFLEGENYLIFFKTPEGIFIEHFPSATSPLIREDFDTVKEITHYVGGEPMTVPDICLCSEAVALKVFKHFIETGERIGDYKWVDISNYINLEDEDMEE